VSVTSTDLSDPGDEHYPSTHTRFVQRPEDLKGMTHDELTSQIASLQRALDQEIPKWIAPEFSKHTFESELREQVSHRKAALAQLPNTSKPLRMRGLLGRDERGERVHVLNIRDPRELAGTSLTQLDHCIFALNRSAGRLNSRSALGIEMFDVDRQLEIYQAARDALVAAQHAAALQPIRQVADVAPASSTRPHSVRRRQR
jgi:hypothetical protein